MKPRLPWTPKPRSRFRKPCPGLFEGRTTFAIAHRLSTLRNASRLMVMERGKLVELGTHDELLDKPEGVFRRLVDMQQEVNKLKTEFLEA